MVKDKWWKAALELEVGDILITSNGKEEVVKSINVEEKGYPVTTYNLTVEDNHTFFVSSEGVLTHNTFELKLCNTGSEVVEMPTNLEYSKAVFDSMQNSGFTREEPLDITRQSIK